MEQYYIPKDHEPIVSMDVHEMVLKEIERRKSLKLRYTGIHPFSGKIICGKCHGFYRIVCDSNYDPRYKKIVWKCSTRQNHKEKCNNQGIHDSDFLLCVEYAIKARLRTFPKVCDDVFCLLCEVLKPSKRKGGKVERLERIEDLITTSDCLGIMRIDVLTMESLFQNATILQNSIISIKLIDGSLHKFRIPMRKEHGMIFPLT